MRRSGVRVIPKVAFLHLSRTSRSIKDEREEDDDLSLETIKLLERYQTKKCANIGKLETRVLHVRTSFLATIESENQVVMDVLEQLKNGGYEAAVDLLILSACKSNELAMKVMGRFKNVRCVVYFNGNMADKWCSVFEKHLYKNLLKESRTVSESIENARQSLARENKAAEQYSKMIEYQGVASVWTTLDCPYRADRAEDGKVEAGEGMGWVDMETMRVTKETKKWAGLRRYGKSHVMVVRGDDMLVNEGGKLEWKAKASMDKIEVARKCLWRVSEEGVCGYEDNDWWGVDGGGNLVLGPYKDVTSVWIKWWSDMPMLWREMKAWYERNERARGRRWYVPMMVDGKEVCTWRELGKVGRMVLHGEEGIGKTRLMRRMVEEWMERGDEADVVVYVDVEEVGVNDFRPQEILEKLLGIRVSEQELKEVSILWLFDSCDRQAKDVSRLLVEGKCEEFEQYVVATKRPYLRDEGDALRHVCVEGLKTEEQQRKFIVQYRGDDEVDQVMGAIRRKLVLRRVAHNPLMLMTVCKNSAPEKIEKMWNMFEDVVQSKMSKVMSVVKAMKAEMRVLEKVWGGILSSVAWEEEGRMEENMFIEMCMSWYEREGRNMLDRFKGACYEQVMDIGVLEEKGGTVRYKYDVMREYMMVRAALKDESKMEAIMLEKMPFAMLFLDEMGTDKMLERKRWKQ